MINRSCEVIVTVIEGNDKKSLDLNMKSSDSIEDFRKRVERNLNGILPKPKPKIKWEN